MKRSKTVEEYIENAGQWQEEVKLLRSIINESKMEETLKWGAPVYTVDGKNVVGLGAFKAFVGLWFFQGALLKDDSKVLLNAQDGRTKALRQMRFNSIDEINKQKSLIIDYVEEAIRNQIEGKSIKPQKKELVIPNELQEALEANPDLKSAFENLTPGKQKDYAEHISSAKRADTKMKRLEKIKPMIQDGIGLYDKYKNC